jgi:hypothetical protein
LDKKLGLLCSASCICLGRRVMLIIQTRNDRIWVAILLLAILGICIASIIFLSGKAQEPFTIDGLYALLE